MQIFLQFLWLSMQISLQCYWILYFPFLHLRIILFHCLLSVTICTFGLSIDYLPHRNHISSWQSYLSLKKLSKSILRTKELQIPKNGSLQMPQKSDFEEYHEIKNNMQSYTMIRWLCHRRNTTKNILGIAHPKHTILLLVSRKLEGNSGYFALLVASNHLYCLSEMIFSN